MTIDPDNDKGKIIGAFLRLSAAYLRVEPDDDKLATVVCGDVRLARKAEGGFVRPERRDNLPQRPLLLSHWRGRIDLMTGGSPLGTTEGDG